MGQGFLQSSTEQAKDIPHELDQEADPKFNGKSCVHNNDNLVVKNNNKISDNCLIVFL